MSEVAIPAPGGERKRAARLLPPARLGTAAACAWLAGQLAEEPPA